MSDDNQTNTPASSPDNSPQPTTGGLDTTSSPQPVVPPAPSNEALQPTPQNSQTTVPTPSGQQPTDQPEDTSPTPPGSPPPPADKPTSSVVMTPKGPRKFDNKKIATAVGAILLLIAGIASGTLLIRSQQNVEEKAARVSPIPCPIEPAEGRIIVNFNEKVLYSNKDATDATTGETTASIPQGNYKVTLVSYDDHSTKDQGQNQESYFVSLNNSSGIQIATTNSISDLPENQDFLSQEVNTNLNVSQQTASVAAFHSAYPPKTTSPNSVVPVCVAFEEIAPEISAQCNQVNAYDSGWNLLSTTDLSELEVGDIVRFAASGSTTSGVIDKAKFSINDFDIGETTEKRAETEEFYVEYEIPEGAVEFAVNAQLHHSELGWF